MTVPHTKVEVSILPDCDFCGGTAHYDGKTTQGPWGNMCESCFHKYGVGLGLGRGQELVVKDGKDEEGNIVAKVIYDESHCLLGHESA